MISTYLRSQLGLRSRFLAVLVSTFALMGCGPAEAELPCSGHGEMHGDHCHCDSGFALSDDGSTCVTAPAENGVGGGDGGALSFTPRNPRAATGLADDGTRVWLLEAVDANKVLELSIYEAYGGPTSATVVDITDSETSYATCGTCLILRSGCVEHNGHFDCQRSFMPRARGKLYLDALGASAGDRITGEMVDLIFQEVTIGDRGQTSPVADGEVLNLDPWEFDLRLESLGGGGGGQEEECSGHGRLHGNHCDCDPGYRLDPQNPMRCIPT